MYDSWTKALDLERWAKTVDARARLPALVRRLIWARAGDIAFFSFPAGEGVQRPGWDGRLTVGRGAVWVPEGSSVWEMSTGDPAEKAAENYKKRSESTPAAEAAGLVFVFVTPQKWTGKNAWIAEQKAEGI